MESGLISVRCRISVKQHLCVDICMHDSFGKAGEASLPHVIRSNSVTLLQFYMREKTVSGW